MQVGPEDRVRRDEKWSLALEGLPSEKSQRRKQKPRRYGEDTDQIKGKVVTCHQNENLKCAFSSHNKPTQHKWRDTLKGKEIV